MSQDAWGDDPMNDPCEECVGLEDELDTAQLRLGELEAEVRRLKAIVGRHRCQGPGGCVSLEHRCDS